MAPSLPRDPVARNVAPSPSIPTAGRVAETPDAGPRSNAARLRRILDRLDVAICGVLRCPGEHVEVIFAVAIDYHLDAAVLIEHALPKAEQMSPASLARLVRGGVWHHVRLAQAVRS